MTEHPRDPWRMDVELAIQMGLRVHEIREFDSARRRALVEAISAYCDGDLELAAKRACAALRPARELEQAHAMQYTRNAEFDLYSALDAAK